MKINIKYAYFGTGLLASLLVSVWFLSGNGNPDISNAIGVKNIVPVAIVGSGPAGMSAGIYAARSGLHAIIFEGSKPGGLLTETTDVENWPGEESVMGPDLIKNMKTQTQKLGVQFLSDTVESVDFSSWPYTLHTADGHNIHAMTVIVATGANPRVLGVEGEKTYWGNGVSACATCDAPFYKEKSVIVVGGGDSAAEQVLQLAPHVKDVTVLVRKDRMRACTSMQQKVANLPNAKVLYNHKIRKINGEGSKVVSVELLDGKDHNAYSMPIDGVFLAIGHDPASKIFKNKLKMDGAGYLVLSGRSQKTDVPGVFAAGEISDHVYRQAIVAAGEGAKAGLDAISFLRDIDFNQEVAEEIEDNYFEVAIKRGSTIRHIKTVAEFDEAVIDSKLPTVIDFYTDYCASCMHMMPAYEGAAQKLKGKVQFLKVNADDADELTRKLYIMKVPCFLLYKDGALSARYQDTMTKREMIDLFGNLAS